MDGYAMVKAAARWQTLDDQHICSTPPDEIRRFYIFIRLNIFFKYECIVISTCIIDAAKAVNS